MPASFSTFWLLSEIFLPFSASSASIFLLLWLFMSAIYSSYLQENQFVRVSLSTLEVKIYLISLIANIIIYRNSTVTFFKKFKSYLPFIFFNPFFLSLKHVKKSLFIIYVHHPLFEIWGIWICSMYLTLTHVSNPGALCVCVCVCARVFSGRWYLWELYLRHFSESRIVGIFNRDDVHLKSRLCIYLSVSPVLGAVVCPVPSSLLQIQDKLLIFQSILLFTCC